MWCTRGLRRRSAAVLVLTPLLLGLPGCGGGDPEGITEIRDTFESGDAGSVIGRERTVEGWVQEVISPWAFTVGGEEPSDVEPLLVIEKDMPPVDQDDPVRVTGPVGEFDLDEVQEELGRDLAENLYDQYQGEPYIMAESIAEDVEID
jgi:hypothetical protein